MEAVKPEIIYPDGGPRVPATPGLLLDIFGDEKQIYSIFNTYYNKNGDDHMLMLVSTWGTGLCDTYYPLNLTASVWLWPRAAFDLPSYVYGPAVLFRNAHDIPEELHSRVRMLLQRG